MTGVALMTDSRASHGSLARILCTLPQSIERLENPRKRVEHWKGPHRRTIQTVRGSVASLGLFEFCNGSYAVSVVFCDFVAF